MGAHVADVMSVARLLLATAVVWCGVAGQGRLAGVLLVLAAATDVVDGRMARRRGPTRRGALLDAIADTALLVATSVALTLLHPQILTEQGAIVAATGAVYGIGMVATWRAERRLVDPRRLTGKIAGGALYTFALLTFFGGVYLPVLLATALLALALSGADAILSATRTIQMSATPSTARSHAPHHVNGVSSKTPPTASIATSTIPGTIDSKP